MSNTLLVRSLCVTPDSIVMQTMSDPEIFFNCQYDGEDAFIQFFSKDSENYLFSQKLQIAKDLLSEDSNFKTELSEYYESSDDDSIELKSIFVKNSDDDEYEYQVQKDTDVETLAMDFYRNENHPVFSDDTEEDIVTRMAKIKFVSEFISQRFEEEVMNPWLNERCSRALFFDEEERAKFYAEGEKELFSMLDDFVANFEVDDGMTEEVRIYVAAVKADFKKDYKLRDELLKSVKSL